MPSDLVLAVAGWLGTALYLACYAYVGLVARWRPRPYFGGNLLAAALLATTSAALGTWQAVGVNAFWLVVSLQRLRGRDVAPARLATRVLPVAVVGIAAAAAVAAMLDTTQAVALLGWSSVAAFCGSYLFFAAGRLTPRRFQAYNAWGATSLLPQAVADANWPIVGLESAWAVLSVIAWIRGSRSRPAEDPAACASPRSPRCDRT
jgi:hypothetical protein